MSHTRIFLDYYNYPFDTTTTNSISVDTSSINSYIMGYFNNKVRYYRTVKEEPAPKIEDFL